MSRLYVPLVIILAVLLGCGGGGASTISAPAGASLDLSVTWPTRSRVVPTAAESIRTLVKTSIESSAAIGELVLARPASSGRILNIPVGSHFVISEALDSNGKVLAARTIQVDFAAGANVEMPLDLDSSIASIAISPLSPSIPEGGSRTLAASALNDKGEAVFLTPSKLEWTVRSGERHASVDLKSGVVTGILPGEAVVRVLDTESGVFDDVVVTVATAPGLQELEPGSDRQTLGFKASDDGSVIIGTTVVNSIAFRWTTATSTQFLGALGGSSSLPNEISGDGRVIVGWADTNGLGHRAFRWTESGGMQNLGTMGGTSSYAYGTNIDGSVVVGSAAAADGTQKAFIWRASTGMKLLEPTFTGQSIAMGISADGKVIVGQAVVDGVTSAFRWTEAGGVKLLGTFGGWSVATAANADGSVIVGTSQVSGAVRKGFVWSESTGLRDLGTLGGSTSGASDISSDGSIVVGTSQNAEGAERAFYWTLGGGMFAIGTLGGQNSTAHGISGDGKLIVGSALNTESQAKAFRMMK